MIANILWYINTCDSYHTETSSQVQWEQLAPWLIQAIDLLLIINAAVLNVTVILAWADFYVFLFATC